jgi:hypothetical protein
MLGASSLTIDLTTTDSSGLYLPISAYLYEHYYCFAPNLFDAARRDMLVFSGHRFSDPSFVDALKRANPGSGYESPGWTVSATTEKGQVFVTKDGVTLFIDQGGVLPHASSPLDDIVAVHFPNESCRSMPGFYLAYSNLGPENAKQSSRIYLNLHGGSATRLIHTLLQALLDEGIRYTLKIVNDARMFIRRDNTVLYVSRHAYDRVAGILQYIYSHNRDAFKNKVPGMTLLLAPGISVADNPVPDNVPGATHEHVSFGQHRMSLIAKGIVDVLREKHHSHDQVLASICRSFSDSGVDADRPYLNSFTSVPYGNVFKEIENQ